VTAQQASALGVLQVSNEDRVVAFVEKPHDGAVLQEFALEHPAGHDAVSQEPLTHLASMGVYVFRPRVLRDILSSSDEEDFGRGVIPSAISRYKVVAFRFPGYWEDIGTISSFYRANLELTDHVPRFNLFDPNWPIYTRARFLPPAKLNAARVKSALIAEGCVVESSEIERSIVGLRSVIGSGCVIRDSILMGNDYYQVPAFGADDEQDAVGRANLYIGPGCHIEGAIIDKNCQINESVDIWGRPGSGINIDAQEYYVRDGIVVVPRAAVVPSGTKIVV
jgi:glucose-1-phosphate adenylyltransferase